MAASVANSTYFAFGSNGSVTTEVDRSSYFNSVNMPMEMATVDTTTFGNSGNSTFLAGLKSATCSAEGNWDATINTHLEGIYNGQDVVQFEYGPAGNTSGLPKFSGSFLVTSYEQTSPVGDKLAFSVTFQISGAVTLGTFA